MLANIFKNLSKPHQPSVLTKLMTYSRFLDSTVHISSKFWPYQQPQDVTKDLFEIDAHLPIFFFCLVQLKQEGSPPRLPIHHHSSPDRMPAEAQKNQKEVICVRE